MTDDERLRFDLGFILKQSGMLKRLDRIDEPHWRLAERIIAELRERGWRIAPARAEDANAYARHFNPWREQS